MSLAHILTSIFFPFLQNISPKLKVENHIVSQKEVSFQSSDNEVYFNLKSLWFKFLSGWISVNVEIDSDCMMSPVLYFDFGDGYSHMRSVTMLQVDENTYLAELMLPKSPKQIRFSPVDKPCDFKIIKFQIKAHSEILHILYQFMSISLHDYKMGESPLEIYRKSHLRYKKHKISGMLERLEKDYKRLYPFRVQRATSRHVKYLNWIRENERNRHEIYKEENFQYKPLISIIMPVYNTEERYLKEAIESVIGQSYPYWELCIADDASNNKATLKVLKKYNEKYEAIKVIFRETNGHISLASNSALSCSQGEYVAFLDHDDLLAPHALLKIVKAINQMPEAKMIYSDEDKIDEKGRRYDPHFKSSWNPDMFYSQNYISHLTVIQKKLVDTVGAFRVGYEGAQDYDLYLRVSALLNKKEIIHVPQILYHWRATEGSTAFNPEAKTYTSEAGFKALKDYFSLKSEKIEVNFGLLPNTYKVNYSLKDEPLVSIIIPTRDGYDILSKCIRSILKKTKYEKYEIIIVDNQSQDTQTLVYLEEMSKKYKHIRIEKYDKAFNYSAINNYAVARANGDVIALLNNDIEVISEYWLEEMLQHALRDEIGAVGAKLYYANDRVQHAGVVLGVGGVAGHSHKHYNRSLHGYFSRLKIIQNYAAVTSACLLVRKSVYEEVGGMNEDYLKVAFNDIDLCLKIFEKGYRNLWTPYAELYHYESVTRGIEDNPIKLKRFAKERDYMIYQWQEILLKDPCYNPNLTLKHENFTIDA